MEAVKCYEYRHPPSTQPLDVQKWTPVAQLTTPTSSTVNGSQHTDELKFNSAKSGASKRIRLLFNGILQPKANCERPDGQSSNGSLHKCRTCNKLGCRMPFHNSTCRSSQQSSYSSYGRNLPLSSNGNNWSRNIHWVQK